VTEANSTGTVVSNGATATPTTKTQQPLLAVYLFNGDDDLKREIMLKRLSDRVAETGDIQMNSQTFSPESFKDTDSLLDALCTPPFGGQYRLAVINNAEKLSKDQSETLITYLQDPVQTTVLALVANKLATNTRLYKAIKDYNSKSIIDISSVKRSELPQQVRGLAEGYHIGISYEAAQSLIDRVGTSMVVLNNEVRRLAAWVVAAGRNDLTVTDIVEQVPALIEPKPWELADAICERNAAQAIRMYHEMNSSTPTAVFLHCVARLREVLSIIALMNRGVRSSSQIASALKKQDWMIRSSLQAAKRFSESELTELLKNAYSVEAAMKSGADAEEALTLWILQVCQKQPALS